MTIAQAGQVPGPDVVGSELISSELPGSEVLSEGLAEAWPVAAAGPDAVGSSSTRAIATRGLTKRFRSGQVAVNALDLTVPQGAVYGFLGPNGSGKTTTIRMLLGLVGPTAGSVQLLGAGMPRAGGAVLPRVGALIEGPAFHPYLSGRSNLRRLDAVDRTANPRTSGPRIDEALSREIGRAHV